MKLTLILAAAALVSLAFTAPLAHASRQKAHKRGRSGRHTSRRKAAQPVPVFDPSLFREGIPPPPAVTVAHRNFPSGSPELNFESPVSVQLRRLWHAFDVLRARIYAASNAAPGKRADTLFDGRLAGSDQDPHDQHLRGGHSEPPATISDMQWASKEFWLFFSLPHLFNPEGAEDRGKGVYPSLLRTICARIDAVLGDVQHPLPGLEPAVFRQVYADEFILWFGAWLPHLDAVAAWAQQERSNPQARLTPLDALAALTLPFFSPFDALCASSTFTMELLPIVFARFQLLIRNPFLLVAGVDVWSPEFEGAVKELYRILPWPEREMYDGKPAEMQQRLCGAEDGPLLKLLSSTQVKPKSARKV